MKNRLFKLSATVFSVAFTTPLFADPYHYVNQLIGERASGLAGAYTAIADDAGGLFYNPAGIVYSSGRNLSGSLTSFYSATTTYNDALDTGLDYTRTSSSPLPNFLGGVQPLGDGTFGWSYVITDSLLEDQDQTFRNFGGDDPANPTIGTYIVNFNNQLTVQKLGASYAYSLTDSLSVGLTLYGHMRDTQSIQNQEIFKNDNTFEWQNSYNQISEFGINPILGIMWAPVDKLSLGITLQTTSILSSTQEIQQTCISDIAGTSTQCSVDTDTDPLTSTLLRIPAPVSSTALAEYPISTTIGLAYFPTSKILLSGDFSYHTATNVAVETWNIAAGVEYYLNPKMAIRAGFYTDNANTPELSATATTPQAEHIDNMGITTSVSWFTRNSSLSVGVNYVTGAGEADLFGNASNYGLQTVDYQSFSGFFASSYSY